MKIEQFLAAGHALASAQQSLREPVANRPVLYSDIYRYCAGEDDERTERVRRALTRDLGVRRLYRQILDRQQKFTIPVAAAAADGEQMLERSTDFVRLRLQRARSHPQFYLTLRVIFAESVEDGTELVAHLERKDEDDDILEVQRFKFPPLQDGRSQIVVDADDPLVALFQNQDTSIVIR